MDSFSSSYHHNRSMNGAPLGRIVMSGPKILYRNREYLSASDALVDYIQEFEGSRRKSTASQSNRYTKDVLELLTTGLARRGKSSRERPNGVSDRLNGVSQRPNGVSELLSGVSMQSTDGGSKMTLRELRSSSTLSGEVSRLDMSRASLEQSYRRMKEVDSAIEVAHTLNKSHDVLRKVEDDRLSEVGEDLSRCDMRSLATDSLISVGPYPLTPRADPVIDTHPEPDRRRGHIYSYRTPRSRSHTVTGVTFTGRDHSFIHYDTNSALKTDLSVDRESVSDRGSFRTSLPESGRQGRQLSSVKPPLVSAGRYRSRSVSPHNVNPSRYMPNPDTGVGQASSWLDGLDNSWESRLGDTGNFRAAPRVRGTPSWIEDIVGSSASSVTQSESQTDRASTEHGPDFSVVSDSSKTSSNLAPLLRVSDLDIRGEPPSGTRVRDRQMPVSAHHIHTSTPHKAAVPRNDTAKYGLMNGLPDRFRLSSDNLDGRTVSSIDSLSNTRLSRSVGHNADMRVDCAENNDKISKMLEELDVIKTKLKSSSDDTSNCLRELTLNQGGGNSAQTPGQKQTAVISERANSGILREEDPVVRSASQDNEQESLDVNATSPTSAITDELLQGDRPWEVTPVPLVKTSSSGDQYGRDEYERTQPGVIGDFLTDCLNGTNAKPPQEQSHNTLTGGAQPGSMEALKNMLFKLQTEASTSQESASLTNEERDLATQGREVQGHPKVDSQDDMVDPARVEPDQEYQTEPGAQCLERALVHLSRLKTLVQGSTFNPEQRNKSSLNAPSSSQ